MSADAPVTERSNDSLLRSELEVHDIVSTPTRSREEAWAVEVLNHLSMIPVLQAKATVFSAPVLCTYAIHLQKQAG